MTVGSLYADVLGLLADVERVLCTTQIAAWRAGSDGDWVCIASNIESETALAPADFRSLLANFLGRLAAGAPACEAWKHACWDHQFRGASVPQAQRPQVLGRAMFVPQYADLIFDAGDSEFPDSETVREFLRDNAGDPDLAARYARILNRAPLGRHVLWATFNPAAP